VRQFATQATTDIVLASLNVIHLKTKLLSLSRHLSIRQEASAQMLGRKGKFTSEIRLSTRQFFLFEFDEIFGVELMRSSLLLLK